MGWKRDFRGGTSGYTAERKRPRVVSSRASCVNDNAGDERDRRARSFICVPALCRIIDPRAID